MDSSASKDVLEASVSQDQPQCTAPELLLKVVLAGTLSHYETCGMIDDKRLEHMLLAGKQILYKSHQESDVRYGPFYKSQLFCLCPGSFLGFACVYLMANFE